MSDLIPIVGILMGILSIIALYLWMYFDKRNERKTILELAKITNDPSKIQDLIENLDEKDKPIDYRRSGVITVFVGIGIIFMGIFSLGDFFVGLGFLISAIGIGTIIAGYLFPNTSSELTDAVEKFEKK